jgi:putative Holliday junction resolvase
MRVLGVDLGLKRTGLAVSDELRVTARALPNLTPKSRAEDIAFLIAEVRSLDVSDVVIGLASLRSGDDSMMAKRAKGFATALENALSDAGLATRVHLVDESGTSKAAAARLVASGVPKGKRKEALDGEVARLLVLDWISANPAPSAAKPR